MIGNIFLMSINKDKRAVENSSSNLHAKCPLKHKLLVSQTWGKWLIHSPKHRKENKLQSHVK